MIFLLCNAWKYAQKDRWKIVVFCILHSISFVGELIQPYAFGKAINVLQTNGTQDLYNTFRWLGIYLIGFFGFQIFHHSARYLEVTTARKNQQRFINIVYEKIYRLPIKWHNEHHTGSVVNRIKVAGEALRDFSFEINTY